MRRLLLLLLILIAPACDSFSTSGTSPQVRAVDPSDPCSLLRPEEVAVALSMEVDRPVVVDSHADSEGRTVPLCVYETGRPYDSVAVQLETGVSAADFERSRTRDPINTVRLSGVGDDAFVHAGTSVSLLLDGQVVNISLQKFGRHAPTDFVFRRLAREAESALRAERYSAIGRVNVKVAPRPSADSTLIWPPWASTMPLVM